MRITRLASNRLREEQIWNPAGKQQCEREWLHVDNIPLYDF